MCLFPVAVRGNDWGPDMLSRVRNEFPKKVTATVRATVVKEALFGYSDWTWQ